MTFFFPIHKYISIAVLLLLSSDLLGLEWRECDVQPVQPVHELVLVDRPRAAAVEVLEGLVRRQTLIITVPTTRTGRAESRSGRCEGIKSCIHPWNKFIEALMHVHL